MTEGPFRTASVASAMLATVLSVSLVPVSQAAQAGKDTVATVGGKAITMAELQEVGKAELQKLRQQEYETLRNVLESMVNDRILEAEAKAQSTTVKALLATNVEAKVAATTDAEADAFYLKYQSQIKQPKEAIYDRIKAQVRQEKQGTLYRTYVEGLRAKAGVKLSLQPPRVEVAVGAEDPSKGSKSAPITIVEFSDFECGYCSRVTPTIAALQKKYGDKIRIVFRDFPLDFHKKAQKAAEAGQCANDQNKFWEMHDHMFANQRALEVDQLKAYAVTLGLDAAKFNTCLDTGKHEAEVKKDFADGAAAGVSGTPAFFVNGRFIAGAVPLDKFSAMIDEELALLN